MTDTVPRPDDGRPRPLRVMQSFRFIRTTTNPYLIQLVASLPPEVATGYFSWHRAITGRYDVLHVHWPENLFQGRQGALRGFARRALLLLLLVRIRLSSVALVRTLHNVSAHERRPPVERWLLDRLDRASSLWIRLNPDTPVPSAAPVRTILMGHFRDWFARYPVTVTTPGRLLSFGLIRPYKGVESLIHAFSGTADAALSLHIVGKPISAELEREVTRLAAADARIVATLDYVDESALAAEIGAAELVVLPYRAMHNSSALLVALSLDRPVLVPENPVTIALRDEVGADWVATFEGDLTPAAIITALERTRTRRPALRPDLSRRDWRTIGEQHRDAYRTALGQTAPESRAS